MKLEAATRLKATTKLECGCPKLTAAPVSVAVTHKFIKALFENAGLRNLGCSIRNGTIYGRLFDGTYEKVIKALKKAGFTKPWKKGSRQGLSIADGTWPVYISKFEKGGHATFSINVGLSDTLDNTRKSDVKAMKKVVKEVASKLGAKITKLQVNSEYSVSALVDSNLTIKDAMAQMKGYGKPKSFRDAISYKMSYGNILLDFEGEGAHEGELVEIKCSVQMYR